MSAARYLGQKFGKLLVLSVDEARTTTRALYVLCRCDCGREFSLFAASLTRSEKPTAMCRKCGQVSAAASNRRHGASKSSLYKIWGTMKSRCLHPTSDEMEKVYRARGITICQEWQDDFVAFAKAVGPRPSPQHSLDRIDNDKGYEPGNVRWATKREQTANRRCTVFAMWKGEWTPIADIARELNINPTRVYLWAFRGQRPRGTPLEHMKPIIKQAERQQRSAA